MLPRDRRVRTPAGWGGGLGVWGVARLVAREEHPLSALRGTREGARGMSVSGGSWGALAVGRRVARSGAVWCAVTRHVCGGHVCGGHVGGGRGLHPLCKGAGVPGRGRGAGSGGDGRGAGARREVRQGPGVGAAGPARAGWPRVERVGTVCADHGCASRVSGEGMCEVGGAPADPGALGGRGPGAAPRPTCHGYARRSRGRPPAAWAAPGQAVERGTWDSSGAAGRPPYPGRSRRGGAARSAAVRAR